MMVVRWEEIKIGYKEGDVLTFKLDLNLLSLSCDKKSNTGGTQTEVLVKAGTLKKFKYKWAFGIYQKDTSFTVMDLSWG